MSSILPFIKANESKWNFTEDTESALALLFSLPVAESDTIDEIVKVYYPFKIYESENDFYLFDMLGLLSHKKNLLLPQDISEQLIELNDSDAADLEGLLEKCKATIREPQYGVLKINGLVKEKEVVDYIREGNFEDRDINIEFFEPLFTKKEFNSMRKQLQDAKKETSQRLELIEETITRARSLYDKVKKSQEKQLKEYKLESTEKIKNLEKEITYSIKKITDRLEKENQALNKDYDARVSANLLEINEINKQLADLKNAEGLDWDTRKQRWGLENTLNKLIKEKRSIEKDREFIFSEAEKKVDAEKKEYIIRLEQQKNEESFKEKEILERHASTLNKIMTLQEGITQTEEILIQDLVYLSKLLEIKYEKGKTVHIPFYLYKSNQLYGFVPPLKASDSKSVAQTLKSIFADNLSHKLRKYVEFDTDAFNFIFDKVREELTCESELALAYKRIITNQNMLQSRVAIDMMEVGLYQMLEWQWINERDYITIQKRLIEKINSLNCKTFESLSDPLHDEVEVFDSLEVKS